MDKKSFLRGFGVGVLFAAIILGISFTVRTSDSFVASRAKELGMVYKEKDEDSGLKLTKATKQPKETEQPKKTEKPKVTKAPKETEEPKATPESTPVVTEEPETDDSDSEEVMEEEKDRLEESIRNEAKQLTVNSGDLSSDVCKELERLGIIESAADFDQYLDENGYGNFINVGTYEVSVDDTYDELARKITRRY